MEDLSRGRIQINSDKAKDINDIHIVQVKLQVRSNMRLMIENHENIAQFGEPLNLESCVEYHSI